MVALFSVFFPYGPAQGNNALHKYLLSLKIQDGVWSQMLQAGLPTGLFDLLLVPLGSPSEAEPPVMLPGPPTWILGVGWVVDGI